MVLRSDDRVGNGKEDAMVPDCCHCTLTKSWIRYQEVSRA